MTAKLVAEEGVLKELVLSFDVGDQWLIGRDPDSCQLLVEDLAASRKHALAKKSADGITIENLSLTNPTLVNDEEVTFPRLLRQGDVVKIGDTIFRFYEEAGSRLIEERPVTASAEGEKVPTSSITQEKVDLQTSPEEEPSRNSIFEEESEADSKEQIAHVNFDLTETGRWLLKVVGGPNSGAEFSMQPGHSYVLGSDPNTAEIVFYDNTVSRQHARITVSPEDTITIEDLKSRNGTRLDGELITEKQVLNPSTFVSVGTTSFVIYDREGEMQTIISPLLPSIVKKLQEKETEKKEENASKPVEEVIATAPEPKPEPKKAKSLGPFLLIVTLLGIFALVGIGIQTLFVQEPTVVQPQIDTNLLLTEALAPFPNVKFSYNKTTGRLLLVGHVLTVTDKNQLEYNLQGLNFIKDLDNSGVIIDEYVWAEANQVLARNPAWKGVTVHSPAPGRFVVSGYLNNRAQAEQVWDYLTRNFPYLDLLENKILVEEDVLASITNALYNNGYTAVKPELTGGELTLSGFVQTGQKPDFDKFIGKFKEIPGVRVLNNYVAERERSEAVVNISDRYIVTGSSRIEGGKLNVVINGRILTENDVLDGMRITKVESNYILLEKGGVAYRIDFNQ
jgi:type III secretion system YscD/HrpQ family protein